MTRSPNPRASGPHPAMAFLAAAATHSCLAEVDPGAIWKTLVATGASKTEVCGQLWELGDPQCRAFAVDKARKILRNSVRPGFVEKRQKSALARNIQKLMEINPDLCNEALAAPMDLDIQGNLDLEGLKSLRFLPEGLKVHYWLWLSGCESLEAIPAGLVAEGLVMQNCVALRSLPQRLKIGGGGILLQGCSAWDGIIPADAEITGRIFTDAHPHPTGISLADWRLAVEGQ